MVLIRLLGMATVTAFFLSGCASAPPLPPDLVTGANYALIANGMTKAQVFTILGVGSQQSETTLNRMTLENYVWMPRDDPYAQVLVTFKDGREISKIKVGL